MKVMVIISAFLSLFLWLLSIYYLLTGPEKNWLRNLTHLFISERKPFELLRSSNSRKLVYYTEFQQNQWFIIFSAFFTSTVTAVLAALYF